MTEVITIGSHRELFVDHALIDCLERAQLVLHHPQPEDVALTFDAPWEAAAPGHVTVFKDGDVYGVWGGAPVGPKDR